MISILRLFELRTFTDKETRDNRSSAISAIQNMTQKGQVTDNIILRNSPLSDKQLKLLRRSIGLKHGAAKLMRRVGDVGPVDIKKSKGRLRGP